MDRDWDWDSLDSGRGCEGLAVIALIDLAGKVMGRLTVIRLAHSGTTKHRAWFREDIQQQSGDESDDTEDPSDFCDFGYDVVSNGDSQNNGHSGVTFVCAKHVPEDL
jgi:hypothetical protein